MEALIHHFTLLSDQALVDKTFDPATIEDLMRLFEVDSYKAWAALEAEQQQQLEAAEESIREAEAELDRDMEWGMEEYRRTLEEMERMEAAELKELEEKAETARRTGNLLEKAATIAAKRHIAAAMGSAAASMRSAWKTASGNKVHPS
ncbi:PREDICTED: uncharacterized protein LOC106313708 [Brassica oleracea var. oleracea]|uniref:Uncharacterized protein n=1 Tax=Brassica oleracea var. oleracea TaxID=109376 RepID=A0A0D3E577_BRAOL|nr:PREDICTED: uncharacterized protein LOC106313708 [Brassica oleracea var. oleracea]